ncbi:hypothetical protein Q4566_02295 [Tamlana sp. 2_MG-2023]|uniref:hypothetical protein n=1 Tax=unclassified Tamlana TaxID=2614803 RepID=UPI0026E49503|nr:MULTISPECIES: hypothetical protein [unclassified Tamlana]MDO6759017.1 hypothetical protein [Tamlana sp. 2_MG-2023]MDO6789716.1 hypothetical protein [Tamlana sp. 1_MG-2023]
MKKFYALALISSILFNTSCSSSDDDSSNEPTTPLSVEEGKEQLEENSIELLNKVEAFKNDDALNEIVELAEYLNSSNTSKSSGFKKVAINSIINSAIKDGDDIVSFNAKQSISLVSETPIADDYENEKGTYEWNASIEDFEKTGESDDIIYIINYNGKQAVFSVTDFKTTLAGDENDELPTLAKANLKIDDATMFTQEYKASLQNNSLVPSSINNTTTLGEFVFETSFSNESNNKVIQSLSFKIGSDVIMEYNYTVNGNFNNIEDAENAEDVVDNAKFSFKFLNAELSVSAKDDGLNSDDDLTVDEQIELLNNNIDAEISVNNRKVADMEFYKDFDTYLDWVYNNDTQDYEEVEITEEVVFARLLFDDGTTTDFDVYVDGSFTSLEDKFESVFEAFEKLFENVD